jgi:hypothetical protein
MFPATWLLLSITMIPSNVCGLLNRLSYRELRQFRLCNSNKRLPLCLQEYSGCDPFHSLQLYNNFLQPTGPSFDSTSSVPPSLLHLGGFGRQFDNLLHKQSLQHAIYHG